MGKHASSMHPSTLRGTLMNLNFPELPTSSRHGHVDSRIPITAIAVMRVNSKNTNKSNSSNDSPGGMRVHGFTY